MPRRSFTTPIGTPNRLIVAIVLPSTTRSQFMWVGAMKKSDSSQPRVASQPLAGIVFEREFFAADTDLIDLVGFRVGRDRDNPAGARTASGITLTQ